MPVAKGYASIARSMGMEATSVRQSALNLIHSARRYVGKMQIPSNLREAGISKEEFYEALDTMSQTALADQCTETNPRACTAEDIKEIFIKAFTGKIL